MGLLRLMVRPLRHYADFAGQSSLKEFWAFTLLTALLSIPITIGDVLARSSFVMQEPVSFAALIILWFPNWALGVRRLHSRGLSGFWMFTLIGFALLALISNQFFGQFGWGRYVTSVWTIAAGVNLFIVCATIAFLPARTTDD